MSTGVKWWTRAGAAVTGAAVMLLLPAYAWAADTGVLAAATEAARARRRSSGLGLIGGLCCLVVVGAIVLGVVLITRGRKRR
jgi:hypothetical protein